MNRPVFWESFKIKSSDVDANSKLKFCELVNYMQEAAWNNATSLGFSTYDLLKNNITWVLNHQYFEVKRTPSHGETIKIETWPSGMDRFFVYRNFRIFDASDELILKSFSRWVVLDTEIRKMIAIPKYIASSKINFDRNNEEHSFNKVKWSDNTDVRSFPIKVGWNDLDVNGHINNAQYFRWLVDALDVDILSSRSIKSINIIFKAEGKLGEELSSQFSHISEYETQHRITNLEAQKDLIIANVLFNKN